jgi:serine/threonine protein kinase
LAGTLLTNAFLFPRERSHHSEHAENGEDDDVSVAFSLEFLDTSKEWQRMSRKCKSFIRGCAMVDDSQRLTVSQALKHPWVAHPGFVEAMHAEYARAIADWTPRANTNDLIEHVKDPLPAAKVPETGYEARLHDEVRSRHFPSQMPPMPSQLRTLDASVHTGASLQARLPPIDSSSRALLKKTTSHAGLAATDGNLGRSVFGHSNKRQGEEETPYLSIQDYAPPVIYPATIPREQTLPTQNTWDMQLAGVMDIGGRSGTMLPHKRARL